MEYIIIGLLVLLIVVMYLKNPNEMTNAIYGSVAKSIRDNESEIVMGVYNKLPSSIKSQVGSEVIAEIVSYVIRLATDILDEQ